MKQQAKKWQSKALNCLRQEHAKGRRAALLQLPPGQGKTLVAVRFFRHLIKKGYRLVVATPTRDWRYVEAWACQFKYDLVPTFTWHSTSFMSGDDDEFQAAIVSHRELSAALDGGDHPVLSEWFSKKFKLLIIVDELHRAGRLKQQLSDAYWKDLDFNLPRYLRRRVGHLRWLLLSATPYNPVRLDYDIDQRGHDFQGDIEAIQTEAEQVADEVKITLGALAWLNGGPKDKSELSRYTDALRSTMAADDGSVEMPKVPVAIIPKSSSSIKPAPPVVCRVRNEVANVEKSVIALANIHRKIAGYPNLSDRVATAERLVLGGVPRPPSGMRSLCGHEYSEATVHAVSLAAATTDRGEVGVKLAALEALIKSVLRSKDEKVLIFCVHRAVATAVARHLRKTCSFAKGEVVDTTPLYGTEQAMRCNAFNEPSKSPHVLVTTDKLSESINLHRACSILVHFELPWSPLRVLQRVGRLWRIRSAAQKRPSRAPNVFHVIHPCSVEEEILNRLLRRWAYLGVLGLNYMPEEYGLGVRIPSVPW